MAALASLFRAERARLVGALRAAARALSDVDAPSNAIVLALAAALGRTPATPRAIHFFHGTRAFDPQSFVNRGLLPMSAVLDEIWHDMKGLANDVPEAEFESFRQRLEDGPIQDLTYRHRRRMGASDDGPHGVLIRDVLVNADAYGSSTEFLRVPEIIGDICFAAHNELKIDLEKRFLRTTTSCIVEFAVESHEVDNALAAACWYAEAALRNTTAGHRAFHNFGDGVAVPPVRLVCVEVLDAPTST